MLNSFSVRNGQLIVRQTGAAIALDSNFFTDIAKVAGFTLEVSAISAARVARQRVLNRQDLPALKICFLPNRPQVWYAIWPVCHLAGIETVKDPADADILFYFDDCEFSSSLPPGFAGKTVINGQCLDIRKSRVAGIFEDVFGYPLSVDPHTYSGIAMMKSERNGVHDGQIVPCPYVVPRDGIVFQRLIDNTLDGRIYTDIRTPVVGGSLPVTYLQHRTASTRFSRDNIRVDLSGADQQFSRQEQSLILEFARHIGLDFGVLDVLRDRRDGLIYIVDVNKTDMGPPTTLPRTDKILAMQQLADAFRAWVEPMSANTIRAA